MPAWRNCSSRRQVRADSRLAASPRPCRRRAAGRGARAPSGRRTPCLRRPSHPPWDEGPRRSGRGRGQALKWSGRPQAGGGGGQQFTELGVLPPGAASGLLQLPPVLPPQQKGGEFPVDGGEKVRQVDTPVREVTGKVLGQGPAPLQQEGGGVVEGVEGAGVLLLPAELAQGAGPADPLRRPVEDYRRILLRRHRGGPAEAVVQVPEGGGKTGQLGAHRLQCRRELWQILPLYPLAAE